MKGGSFQHELLSLFNSILPKATAFLTNHGMLVLPLVAGTVVCSVGVWKHTLRSPLSIADFIHIKLGQVVELSRLLFPAFKIRGFTRCCLNSQ